MKKRELKKNSEAPCLYIPLFESMANQRLINPKRVRMVYLYELAKIKLAQKTCKAMHRIIRRVACLRFQKIDEYFCYQKCTSACLLSF